MARHTAIPMSNWPKNIDACVSCTGSADRYPHGARGNCARCNDILRHIRHVKAWDRNRPETLKHIPDDGTRIQSAQRSGPKFIKTGRLMTVAFSAAQFEKVRAEYLRQLERRLALFRSREEIRRLEFPVRGLEVEEKFQQLLALMRGVRRRDRVAYPQNASYINHHFDAAQRRVLYALLEEVIELVPWRGIDWGLV